MADIFISYAREDREWVEKLANQLVAEGFTVWWDWDLLVGKRYRETIETELQTAKAAIVVWSQHSIRSDFVRDEAEDGQQRNILLPLLKEIVRPPAGFRQLQTADLSNWNGGGEHIEFRRMMKGVSHLVGRTSLGDTGEIHVDPRHPTTRFEPQPPEAAAAAAPAAPAATPAEPAEPAATPVAPPVTPATVAPAAKAPEPPAPKAPEPAPPVHTAVPTPPKTNPVVMYIAIGAVVLIALVIVVVALMPGSKPTSAVTPVTSAPTAHVPTPTAPPPAVPTTPPPNPGDGGASGNGGGDEGQSGPHHETPPPAPATPPVNNSAGDNGGNTGGDTSGDVGQGNPH